MCMVYAVVMNRFQLILEDWQHAALKSRAEREGRSTSALVREAVEAYLATPGQPTPARLDDIEGIGSDAEASGRDHDDLLYARTPAKRRPSKTKRRG